MKQKKELNFHTKTTIGCDAAYDLRKERCAAVIANVRALDFSKSPVLRNVGKKGANG